MEFMDNNQNFVIVKYTKTTHVGCDKDVNNSTCMPFMKTARQRTLLLSRWCYTVFKTEWSIKWIGVEFYGRDYNSVSYFEMVQTTDLPANTTTRFILLITATFRSTSTGFWFYLNKQTKI